MFQSLPLLFQSGISLISMESTDETAALRHVQQAAREINRPLFVWSMTQGLRQLPEHDPEIPGAVSPRSILPPGKALDVLQHLTRKPERGVYLFLDLGPHCKDAAVHRSLRDVLGQAQAQRMNCVLLDAFPVPEEVSRFAMRYELPMPDSEELEQIVRETFQEVRNNSLYEITSNIKRSEMDQLVQSLRGLSSNEVRRVVSAVILEDHSLCAGDLPRVVEFKRLLLRGSGCLEAIGADFSSHEIGGLNRLKSWLQLRAGGFTRKAREFGLEAPRGVLMLGVPGCGKSLCAKVVAAEWNMPLLRLDPGVLYQKFVGETESQLRRALRQAETMAPCVLWIDEIEKAFASAGASSADGGLSQRMFGTLLSWMQDHRHPIFIVATANDISSLPPELMRKGRFDEVFFVDLPGLEARERILRIHLARRRQAVDQFDLAELAAQAEHFSGSELEQAIITGLFFAFQQQRSLEQNHLEQAIAETRPLAVLTAEKVASIRSWAKNRCVSAD